LCADARGIGVDVDHASVTKENVKDYKEFIAKSFQTGRLDIVPEMFCINNENVTTEFENYLRKIKEYICGESFVGSQCWVDTVALRPGQSTRFNIPMTCDRIIDVPISFLKTLSVFTNICGELIDIFIIMVQERQFIAQALNKNINGLFLSSSFSRQIASGVNSGEIRSESGERRTDVFNQSFMVFFVPIMNAQWMSLEVDLILNKILFVSVNKTLGTDYEMYFRKFMDWLKNVAEFCEPKVAFVEADWKYETKFAEQLGNDVDSGAFVLLCADARGIGVDVDHASVTKENVKDYKEFIAKSFQTGRLDIIPEMFFDMGDGRRHKKQRTSVSAEEILVGMKSSCS
jgi:hypothetical protein